MENDSYGRDLCEALASSQLRNEYREGLQGKELALSEADALERSHRHLDIVPALIRQTLPRHFCREGLAVFGKPSRSDEVANGKYWNWQHLKEVLVKGGFPKELQIYWTLLAYQQGFSDLTAERMAQAMRYELRLYGNRVQREFPQGRVNYFIKQAKSIYRALGGYEAIGNFITRLEKCYWTEPEKVQALRAIFFLHNGILRQFEQNPYTIRKTLLKVLFNDGPEVARKELRLAMLRWPGVLEPWYYRDARFTVEERTEAALLNDQEAAERTQQSLEKREQEKLELALRHYTAEVLASVIQNVDELHSVTEFIPIPLEVVKVLPQRVELRFGEHNIVARLRIHLDEPRFVNVIYNNTADSKFNVRRYLFDVCQFLLQRKWQRRWEWERVECEVTGPILSDSEIKALQAYTRTVEGWVLGNFVEALVKRRVSVEENREALAIELYKRAGYEPNQVRMLLKEYTPDSQKGSAA